MAAMLAGSPTTSVGVERIGDWTLALPRGPRAFEPQHLTTPLLVSAQVCASPAARATTPPVRPTTGAGIARSVVVLSPSWPDSLAPQHLTAPERTMAQV